MSVHAKPLALVAKVKQPTERELRPWRLSAFTSADQRTCADQCRPVLKLRTLQMSEAWLGFAQSGSSSEFQK